MTVELLGCLYTSTPEHVAACLPQYLKACTRVRVYRAAMQALEEIAVSQSTLAAIQVKQSCSIKVTRIKVPWITQVLTLHTVTPIRLE